MREKVIFFIRIAVFLGIGVHFLYMLYAYYNNYQVFTGVTGLANSMLVFLEVVGLFVFIAYLLIYLYRDMVRDLERFLLRNISTISFLIILILGMTLITKKIETLYAVAGIGTVIVFWYNFKKNEKDSDIEFIKYFGEEYDKLLANLLTEREISKQCELFNKLINLWYKEYYLSKNGYLSPALWCEYEFCIKSDISTFLYSSLWGTGLYSNIRNFQSSFLLVLKGLMVPASNLDSSWEIFLDFILLEINSNLNIFQVDPLFGKSSSFHQIRKDITEINEMRDVIKKVAKLDIQSLIKDSKNKKRLDKLGKDLRKEFLKK